MKTYQKVQSLHRQPSFSASLPLRRALNLAILAILYPVFSYANPDGAQVVSGNYHFMAGSSAGNIVLTAPHIENHGIISSDGGSITLAAGHELTITNLDDPEIRFQIQAPADSAVNLGQLLTEGGAINVFASTIKHSGEINADNVSDRSDGSGGSGVHAETDAVPNLLDGKSPTPVEISLEAPLKQVAAVVVSPTNPILTSYDKDTGNATTFGSTDSSSTKGKNFKQCT